MSDRIVIVGASLGGIRAAQALRAAGFDRELVVVGAESEVPYDKPPLSKQVLSGDSAAEDIRLVSPQELDDTAITLRLGVAAGRLDVPRRQVHLVDGASIDYDDLVVATGVRPRTLGSTAASPLVHTIRDLGDAVAVRASLLATGGPLVVVGGGFVGAEVAASAAGMGVSATIVEALPAPFSRVFGPEVGAVVTRLHAEHGVDVVAGTGVTGIEERDDGLGLVHLADGRALPAGVIVAGIGCVPNTEWLEASGVKIDDGVVTDEYCRASGVDRVYAIGDVARWYDVRDRAHRRTEHWTHAFQQAQLVAHNILHEDDLQAHTKAPYFWSDQHGVKIQMVGHRGPDDQVELLPCQTPAGPRDVAVYSREHRFTAAVSFGWPQIVPRLRRAWEQHATLAEVRGLIDAAAS